MMIYTTMYVKSKAGRREKNIQTPVRLYRAKQEQKQKQKQKQKTIMHKNTLDFVED